MDVIPVVAGCLVAVMVARPMFRLLFEDSEDFLDCVRFSMTPDIISLFRKEFLKDVEKSTRLSLYFILVGMAGVMACFGTESLLNEFFPSLAGSSHE